MCGLVGVMGHITQKEKAAFNQLLVVDVLRGKHSTGVALIDHAGEVDVFKKAVNVLDFLDFKTYSDLTRYSHNCMMGHNRYATKGAVNNVNAHPFEFENVVGMHNGTLSNYTKLDNHLHFDVDSECLYAHLNNNPVQDMVDKITGAYALTWFDKRTNNIHFLRNSQRPLNYCYSEDGKTLFWASEAWMLRSVLGRNGIDHKDILSVSEDVLYTFKVPKVFNTAAIKLDAPKVCKAKKTHVVVKSNVSQLPTVKKSTSGQPTYASYINKEVEFCVNEAVVDKYSTFYVEAFIHNDTEKDIRIYCPEAGDLKKELMAKRDLCNFKGKVRRASHQGNEQYLLLDLRTIEPVDYSDAEEEESQATVKGFRGEELTMAEFDYKTRQGCAWCGEHTEFGSVVHFVDDDEFICEGCHAQPEVIEWLADGHFGGLK